MRIKPYFLISISVYFFKIINTPFFRIDIVRQPLPRYVLLIETSSSLSPVWKWVRKAVQNLIRYVVPDNSNVAVVTFNTKAKVEHGMVQLTTEDARYSLCCFDFFMNFFYHYFSMLIMILFC